MSMFGDSDAGQAEPPVESLTVKPRRKKAASSRKTRSELPEKITITTNHWKVPSPEDALDGVLEGRPTDEQIEKMREVARRARTSWSPTPAAYALVDRLRAWIGSRVRFQRWDKLMWFDEELGPAPFDGTLVDVVVRQDGARTAGLPQAYAVIREAAVARLETRADLAGYLVPLADLYEIEALS